VECFPEKIWYRDGGPARGASSSYWPLRASFGKLRRAAAKACSAPAYVAWSGARGGDSTASSARIRAVANDPPQLYHNRPSLDYCACLLSTAVQQLRRVRCLTVRAGRLTDNGQAQLEAALAAPLPAAPRVPEAAGDRNPNAAD